MPRRSRCEDNGRLDEARRGRGEFKARLGEAWWGRGDVDARPKHDRGKTETIRGEVWPRRYEARPKRERGESRSCRGEAEAMVGCA